MCFGPVPLWGQSRCQFEFFKNGGPVHIAAALGNLECVKLLIEHCADVNAVASATKEGPGNTALMYASVMDRFDCVKELMAAGAHVDTTNNVGLTALVYACLFGREDILNMLVNAGADISATTSLNRIFIHGRRSRWRQPPV
jgi:ankyrin repeat protein